MKKKIFIPRGESNDPLQRNYERRMLELYQKSDRKYELVDDPLVADIILIGNFDSRNRDEAILQNPLVNQYPAKCFSLSDKPHPPILNHGIYTSARKTSVISWRRIRTGSYILEPEETKNPFIQNHVINSKVLFEKKYLFSFIGRNSHPVRGQILNMKFSRPDIKVKNSDSFDNWRNSEKKAEEQEFFYQVLLQSKFALCPRGITPNSIRLFESLQLGISPVIISDDWRFPKGPKWEKFSIVIKERHIKVLENIISSHEDNYSAMGSLARKCYEEYFSDETYFNYIVDNCFDIQRIQIIPEDLYWKANRYYLFYLKLGLKIRTKIGRREAPLH